MEEQKTNARDEFIRSELPKMVIRTNAPGRMSITDLYGEEKYPLMEEAVLAAARRRHATYRQRHEARKTLEATFDKLKKKGLTSIELNTASRIAAGIYDRWMGNVPPTWKNELDEEELKTTE